jgi:hypothetical protein
LPAPLLSAKGFLGNPQDISSEKIVLRVNAWKESVGYSRKTDTSRRSLSLLRNPSPNGASWMRDIEATCPSQKTMALAIVRRSG